VERDLVDLIDGTLVSIDELGSDVQLESIRKVSIPTILMNVKSK
jgi:hypothetical protein